MDVIEQMGYQVNTLRSPYPGGSKERTELSSQVLPSAQKYT